MPDESTYSKARRRKIKWLSKELWLMVIDDCLVNSPDRAECLMLMLMSVRHLMLGEKHSEKAKAFHAISNFIEACKPFTRSEVMWELIYKDRQRPDSDEKN